MIIGWAIRSKSSVFAFMSLFGEVAFWKCPTMQRYGFILEAPNLSEEKESVLLPCDDVFLQATHKGIQGKVPICGEGGSQIGDSGATNLLPLGAKLFQSLGNIF